jgi:hypothetical protein
VLQGVTRFYKVLQVAVHGAGSHAIRVDGETCIPLRYVTLRNVMLCYVMVSCVTLCNVVLCCVMLFTLCYVVLQGVTSSGARCGWSPQSYCGGCLG